MSGFTLQPLHSAAWTPHAASRVIMPARSPHAFHRALPRLYDLAEQSPPDTFLQDALCLLRPWLDFEGALFWQGDIAAGLILPSGTVGSLMAHGVPDDQACLGELDRSIGPHLLIHDAPLSWQREELASLLPPASHAWLERAGCRHLMLVGDAPVFERPSRWLLLYRVSERAFGPAEAAALQIGWLHLVRAIEMHRARLLERHDPARPQRATAIATPCGRIMAADANFRRLMTEEWPDGQPGTLPPELVRRAGEGKHAHRGQRIEVTLAPQGSYMVCRATPLAHEADLTPGEYMVARRYATGLTHKKIARELGVSPHTVRNQIAHLYSKLGIHDKAALALYLSVTRSPWKKIA